MLIVESLKSPAVNDDRAAEEILESIDAPSEFEEEMRLPGDAVVRPAHELDVRHLPLWVLLPLLQTDTHTVLQKYEKTQNNKHSTKCIRR